MSEQRRRNSKSTFVILVVAEVLVVHQQQQQQLQNILLSPPRRGYKLLGKRNLLTKKLKVARKASRQANCNENLDARKKVLYGGSFTGFCSLAVSQLVCQLREGRNAGNNLIT